MSLEECTEVAREVIFEIAQYMAENYLGIEFYWGVAKDGWDEERIALVK